MVLSSVMSDMLPAKEGMSGSCCPASGQGSRVQKGVPLSITEKHVHCASKIDAEGPWRHRMDISLPGMLECWLRGEHSLSSPLDLSLGVVVCESHCRSRVHAGKDLRTS